MSPFNPIGDRARWRIIYDVLAQMNVDDVVSYARLGDAIDLHPDRDRHTIQMAVRRAAKHLEEENSRALEVVTNEGYRIVQPTEHLRLARQQQRRSSRALVRGQSKVVHVDMSGMAPDTRQAFEVVAQAFSMQLEMMRRLDVGQRRLAESVKAIQDRTERSSEDIAELRARLDRLENPPLLPEPPNLNI